MAGSKVFERVNEPDSDKVTVTLWEMDGKCVGHVTGITTIRGGQIVTELSPQDGSLTGDQAMDLASKMARKSGVDVVVILSGGCWDPKWGELKPLA